MRRRRTIDVHQLQALLHVVAEGPEPKQIVVIGSRPPYVLARRLASRYGAARVLVLAGRRDAATSTGRVEVVPARTVGRMRRVLAARPAPDVIVDEDVAGDERGGPAFRSLFPMLVDGGRYLLARNSGAAQDPGQERAGGMSAARGLFDLKRELDAGRRPDAPADDLALARCIASIDDASTVLRVSRLGSALLKLHDLDAGEALTGRFGPNWGRELAVRAPGEVVARSRLWVNDPTVQHEFHTRFDVPERCLRLYRDVVCTPRQLVVLGDVVAPISFRHQLRRRLRNRQLSDVGPDHATPKVSLADAPKLAGTYYHLDSEAPGHFGHFMTEDIARLWGWDQARAEFGDLRLLLSVDQPDLTVPDYVIQMLSAFGIDPADVVCIDGPARVERLIGATPEFHNGKSSTRTSNRAGPGSRPGSSTGWPRRRSGSLSPGRQG